MTGRNIGELSINVSILSFKIIPYLISQASKDGLTTSLVTEAGSKNMDTGHLGG
jgi:hypothetical protein